MFKMGISLFVNFETLTLRKLNEKKTFWGQGTSLLNGTVVSLVISNPEGYGSDQASYIFVLTIITYCRQYDNCAKLFQKTYQLNATCA